MKNKILIIFFVFFKTYLFAENINIKAKNIFIDKKKEVTVFKEDVIVQTKDNTQISADYAEYDKKKGILTLKNNIIATDKENNVFKANFANLDENNKILKSIGPTEVIT